MKNNKYIYYLVKEIALEIIKENGVTNISKNKLCKKSGIPPGSFSWIMGESFQSFRDKLIVYDTNNTKKITRNRVYPKLRKTQILNAAVDAAKKVGYNLLTRQIVATAAEVSPGLINRYFNTMQELRQEVMNYAICNEILEIVACGLGNHCPHAKKAPARLKSKAAALIKSR